MWIASTLTHQKIKECWVLHLRVLGRSEPWLFVLERFFLSISPCFSLIHIDVDQTQHPLVHSPHWWRFTCWCFNPHVHEWRFWSVVVDSGVLVKINTCWWRSKFTVSGLHVRYIWYIIVLAETIHFHWSKRTFICFWIWRRSWSRAKETRRTMRSKPSWRTSTSQHLAVVRMTSRLWTISARRCLTQLPEWSSNTR